MSLGATVLGAGFIGKHFLRYALSQGYSLRVLDHNDCPEEFLGKLLWIKGDLSQKDKLSQALESAHTIFHFISSTVPGDVIDESGELKQNVFQTLQLLKLCVRQKIQRVVFISSASVYGVQSVLPIPETASTDPISSHGIHKLTIEKYLKLYRHHHGLDCKILRISNPYGPGQNIAGRQGFVAIAIGKILADASIAISGDGTIIRDFIYIEDVAKALHLAATTNAPEAIFNIGSGNGCSLNEIVDLLRELTGRPLPVIYAESRFVDIPKSVLDIGRAQRILGFSPTTHLKGGLAQTLVSHRLAPFYAAP